MINIFELNMFIMINNYIKEVFVKDNKLLLLRYYYKSIN